MKRLLYIACFILLAAMPAACDKLSYWKFDPALAGFTQLPTERVSQAVLNLRCHSNNSIACTIYQPGFRMVFTLLGPGSTPCIERHELAHRLGWVHDDREHYRDDCGPKDLTPPA